MGLEPQYLLLPVVNGWGYKQILYTQKRKFMTDKSLHGEELQENENSVKLEDTQ